MLSESALRRPEWVEGEPITLADGQVWHFPRPVLGDFGFARDETGNTYLTRNWTWGQEYTRLVDAYLASDGVETRVALFDLAYDLLSRNYAVAVDDCRTLLTVVVGDDDRARVNDAMWSTIAAVALGRAPKVTPVGSEPA